MSDPVPRLKRILSMIPLVNRPGGITIPELAERFGASKKEVLRDLSRIILCGVPPYMPHDYILVHQEGDRVFVDFAHHFSRPVRLTVQEYLALKTALNSVSLTGRLGEIAAELEASADQEATKLGADAQTLTEEPLAGRLGAARKSSAMELKLDRLRVASETHQTVTVDYYSASSDRTSTRTIRPYLIVDKGGIDYVWAWCETRERIIPFRLDRISRIDDAPGQPFELPDDLDLEALARESIGPGSTRLTVRLQFDKAIARWVEEEHDQAPTRKLPNGDLVVELAVGSIPWAAQLVLGYGELVTVLDPPELKDELRSRLDGFLREVDTTGGADP